jgi:hypothetical protein
MRRDGNRSTVHIELNAAGIGTAKVDDLDISNSVMRVTLDAKPGHGTGLTLHMTPGITAAAIDAAGAKVDPATHDALVALGWAPPVDDQTEAREVEGVLCEHVLTWHPVDAPDDAPGVQIPLYQHITLPDGIGELRSHTREVVDAGEDEEPLANPAADLVVDFLALAGVSATAKQVGGWTRAQREEAARWAAATHLSASDNDDVEVPPRPAFLSEVSGG